eukprot:3057861-Pyramimonas_sp.AAC.1
MGLRGPMGLIGFMRLAGAIGLAGLIGLKGLVGLIGLIGRISGGIRPSRRIAGPSRSRVWDPFGRRMLVGKGTGN